MRVLDLRAMFDYSYWANARLFAVITTLTADEFTRDVAGSYGSVRNTLVHIMSAEAGWLDRCGGPPRGPKLEPANYPTAESVVTAWAKLEQEVRAFLGGLTDADIARTLEFERGPTGKRAMPVGALLHHAANHGVHHRGQVATLLRMLGRAPGNVDLLFYFGAA